MPENSSGMSYHPVRQSAPLSQPVSPVCRANVLETADGIGPGHALVVLHGPTSLAVDTGPRKRHCTDGRLVGSLLGYTDSILDPDRMKKSTMQATQSQPRRRYHLFWLVLEFRLQEYR